MGFSKVPSFFFFQFRCFLKITKFVSGICRMLRDAARDSQVLTLEMFTLQVFDKVIGMFARQRNPVKARIFERIQGCGACGNVNTP